MRTTSTRRVLATLLVALAGSLPAAAAFPDYEVYLPMVGRGGGVPPSQWYTKVWAYNPSGEATLVTFYFLERDKDNTVASLFTDTIQPGDTHAYDNAVFTMFGRSGWGAIRVVADRKVVVNARFYNQLTGTAEAESQGQYFAGIPKSFAIGVGESSEVLGVYHTVPASESEHRYNFGFVETTGQQCRVRVTAKDETGATWDYREYNMAPYTQRQIAFRSAFPELSTMNARLTVEVISGSGRVIAYGTGIANTSQDPNTFEMTYASSLLASDGGTLSVSHDATLAGDGTSGSPLGIASGSVTADHLSADGSSSGQVLGSDGSTVGWRAALTLPYSGSGASVASGALFRVSDSGAGIAIDAAASGSAGIAIRGVASDTGSPVNYGGYFESYGANGRALTGATNGAAGTGVYGYASGASGRGVLAEATASAGIGLLGRNTSSGNYAEVGKGNDAIHAVAFAGRGVYAQSTNADGVVGESATTIKSGVYGVNSVSGGFGVFGRNTNTANTGYLGGAYGVYGEAGAGQSWAAAFKGNVKVISKTTGGTILELGEGLDYAEGFDVSEDDVAPGTVLVIDAERPGRLAVASQPYDRAVAGVVAGARGLGSGVRLGASGFDADVALAGRVYCNVDATYGEVSPGDWLTTSPTPGHAMIASDLERARGAVLGKAMEPLAEGQIGQVLVLVTLQ